MVRLLADENISKALVRGLLWRKPDLDLVRVHDVGLAGATDPIILQWAAETNHIALTYDVNTLIEYAYERVREGLSMPGVFALRRTAPLSSLIEDILLLVECSSRANGRIRYATYLYRKRSCAPCPLLLAPISLTPANTTSPISLSRRASHTAAWPILALPAPCAVPSAGR